MNLSAGRLKVFDHSFQKPIRVAGDYEFGEKYHVAAALALEPQLQAVVVGPDRHFARAFLAQFGRERVGSVEKESFIGSEYLETRRSTPIYCSNWSPDAHTRLADMALQEVRAKAADMQTYLKTRIGSDKARAALLWVRNEKGPSEKRNTTVESIESLAELVLGESLRPIPIGAHLDKWQPPTDNLIGFFDDPPFCSTHKISAHLLMFETLMQRHGVCISIGLKSGGMDGAGLFLGLPTVSFSRLGRSSRRVKQIERTIGNFRVIPLSKRNAKIFHDHTDQELEQLRKMIQEWLKPMTKTKLASTVPRT